MTFQLILSAALGLFAPDFIQPKPTPRVARAQTSQAGPGGAKSKAKDLGSTASPRLGSLKVDLHGNGNATVSWQTDVPTSTRLKYWLRPGRFTTITDAGYSRIHSVALAGLISNKVYGFSIQSTSAKGDLKLVNGQSFNSGGGASQNTLATLAGKLVMWFPVTLSFKGPSLDEESSNPNPFLDYRLTVSMTSPSGDVLRVPGYFAGNGLGSGSGNLWRVRFPTHEAGRWTYKVSFVRGPQVAIDNSLSTGTPSDFDGLTGYFDIMPRDPAAPGFYKWGKLLYGGEHYLKFLGGPYFIKAGSNSPENFLGYAGFDNTSDQGGIAVPGLRNGLHEYGPHVKDWGIGGLGDHSDPLFSTDDGPVDSRGIVGALNFLNDRHVNSLFILPMNLGGDGDETCPFVSYDNTSYAKTHYDVSKLHQWDQVLEHAGRRGIMLQFVLNETESANELWLDNGTLGVERKLYYRELIARFGHLLALKWNLCEENDYDTTTLTAFADYIKSLDPYGHPIGFHTTPLPTSGDEPQWDNVLGHPSFSTNSIQAFPYLAGDVVEKWRMDSASAGRKWIVEFDEQTQPLTADNADLLRKKTLYDVLFSGGHLEWYAGYNPLPLGGDLRVEDFGTRDEMWGYTWNARKFLEQFTLFWRMSPMDDLVSGEANVDGGAEVFGLAGIQYVIYLPAANPPGMLDLQSESGVFKARWYNPRSGQGEGKLSLLTAGAIAPLPAPPRDAAEDWVLYLGR